MNGYSIAEILDFDKSFFSAFMVVERSGQLTGNSSEIIVVMSLLAYWKNEGYKSYEIQYNVVLCCNKLHEEF